IAVPAWSWLSIIPPATTGLYVCTAWRTVCTKFSVERRSNLLGRVGIMRKSAAATSGPSRGRDATPTIDEHELVLLAQMLDFLKQILLGEMERVDWRQRGGTIHLPV